MIFGFNTDVKHGSTVYHVQSEAREHERVLQTQVFVRGRCIGKLAVSYAEKTAEPDFSEKQMEKMLRTQHKSVLDAVKEGDLETILRKQDTDPAAASVENKPAVDRTGNLQVEWLNADSLHANGALLIRLMVTEGSSAVEGAQVTSRINVAEGSSLYSQGVTDASGTAELSISPGRRGLGDSTILVQAAHSGRLATRKFRLRKA